MVDVKVIYLRCLSAVDPLAHGHPSEYSPSGENQPSKSLHCASRLFVSVALRHDAACYHGLRIGNSAGVAQMVEHLICNQPATSLHSSPLNENKYLAPSSVTQNNWKPPVMGLVMGLVEQGATRAGISPF